MHGLIALGDSVMNVTLSKLVHPEFAIEHRRDGDAEAHVGKLGGVPQITQPDGVRLPLGKRNAGRLILATHGVSVECRT